jgi:hypothetical protein
MAIRSLVSDIKTVVESIELKTGEAAGVHYLVTTRGLSVPSSLEIALTHTHLVSPGGPSNCRFTLTRGGHETMFAAQLLSRFALAYLPAQSGTLKESWVPLLVAGGPKALARDLEDLKSKAREKAGGFGIVASSRQGGGVMHPVMDGLVAVSIFAFSQLP